MSFVFHVSEKKALGKRLDHYRKMVDKAKVHRRIFYLHPMAYVHFDSIRDALKSRGWLEKTDTMNSQKMRKMTNERLLKNAKEGNMYETILIGRLLGQTPPNFIWQTVYNIDLFPNLTPLRSRIRHSPYLDFTTKEGLARCASIRHWHTIPGVAELTTPRCYVVRKDTDKNDFLQNFKRTACISFLMFIMENGDDIYTEDLGIPDNCIEFAIDRVKEAIQYKCNLSIDTDGCPCLVEEMEWSAFFEDFREIVFRKSAKFQMTNQFKYQKMRILELMDDVLSIWPYTKMDGIFNTWIVKPWNQTCGNGIFLINDYNKIENFLNKNHGRYIIQKYIERPLLIFKTKFDIRQHFLLTMDLKAISIWMYKSCYFRFSSQEYNLDSFNRNVHLTNHSVQKNYENSDSRSDHLPPHNMWTLDEFMDYLNFIGLGPMWSETIYPSMKKNIIAAVLCSQTLIKFENNAFHVYGCDFMISEDFNVILLEINSAPNLTPSTQANTLFFPELLGDALKVVLDYPTNKSCCTGKFELIYTLDVPKTNQTDLEVVAKSYKSSYNESDSQEGQSAADLQRTLTSIASHDNSTNVDPNQKTFLNTHKNDVCFVNKLNQENSESQNDCNSKTCKSSEDNIMTNNYPVVIDSSEELKDVKDATSKKTHTKRTLNKKIRSTKSSIRVKDTAEMFDSSSLKEDNTIREKKDFETFASIKAKRAKEAQLKKEMNRLIVPNVNRPRRSVVLKPQVKVQFLETRFSKPRGFSRMQQNRLLPIKISSLTVPTRKSLALG